MSDPPSEVLRCFGASDPLYTRYHDEEWGRPVVGEREAAEGKVAVRLRSGKDLGPMPLETVLKRIKQEAESRVDMAE